VANDRPDREGGSGCGFRCNELVFYLWLRHWNGGGGSAMNMDKQEALRPPLLKALHIAEELDRELVALYITQALDLLSPHVGR
jgi:hypothetical protein